MELKHIILSEVKLCRPKITNSPSYEDYRSKTNIEILLIMGRTLRGDHTRRNIERKGNLKFECG
jgi:hypothetical protein